MPPPSTPILPSSVCTMHIERMFCEPLEWCVQPSAYSEAMDRSGEAVVAIISQTFRKVSLGEPQIRSTISGV
jgi:hypothetical protein